MLRTKIICTLGPATDDPAILRQLFLSGMSIARINFSHGNRIDNKTRIDAFKAMREELGIPIPLLMDNRGPEIRLKKFEKGRVMLQEGTQFTFRFDDAPGDVSSAAITYPDLYKDIEPGQRILIDDGLVELRARECGPAGIVCDVINSGEISDRKGINVPGARLRLPSMTPDDETDTAFCIEEGFDFIAMSFVRSAEDVRYLRRLLQKLGGGHMRIIAKIENQEGVDNFSAILRNCDGIMVARGDLGVEVPVEKVPPLQKELIKLTVASGKPVITATQMLDSMIRNPRPTRAEASDVANAIFDGTSCIMLSGETASGRYPIESLRTMVRIASDAENSIHYWHRFKTVELDEKATVSNAISHATCTVAMDLNATAILTVTKSGDTARFISRYRPNVPVVATTFEPVTQRQLMLSWGVLPLLVPQADDGEALFMGAVDAAIKAQYVKSGDVIVITAGVPVGISGTTNSLRVEIVGDPMLKGRSVGGGTATGIVHIVGENSELTEELPRGSVLIAKSLTTALLPQIRRISALVVEDADPAGQAETVGLMLGIPVLVEAKGATELLMSGTVVTVDGHSGEVSVERGARG